jgi:hypothetical protein
VKKKQQHKTVVKEPRAKANRTKAVPVVAKRSRPGPPAASAVQAADSSSSSLALLLGVALGLSLLVVAAAATPPWLLPRQVVGPVYEHREAVIVGAVATAVSVAVGLVIALFGS